MMLQEPAQEPMQKPNEDPIETAKFASALLALNDKIESLASIVGNLVDRILELEKRTHFP